MVFFTGISHSSLISGIVYPAFTHFIFGVIGAALGIAAAKGIEKARRRNQDA